MDDRFRTSLKMVLSAVLLLAGCVNRPPDRSALKRALQLRLDRMQADGWFPGATLGVAFADRDTFSIAAGFSDPDSGRSMSLSARMFSGSAGKTFAAAVAIRLAETGRLDLNRRVKEILPDSQWLSRIANHESITVRMLLNHTSGIPRYVLKASLWETLRSDPERILTPVECLSYIFDEPAVHPAGQGWSYSDTNYMILGLVLESVTGHSYETLLHDWILDPLRLDRTRPQSSRLNPGLPMGFTGPSLPFQLPERVLQKDGLYPVHPAFEWTGGGLVTHSMDLARWARILWGSAWIRAGIRKEIFQAMNTSTGKPDSLGYGLGVQIWLRKGYRLFGHGGIFPGYQTLMLYDPRLDCGLAIQVNGDRLGTRLKASLNQMAGELLDVIESQLGACQRRVMKEE